MTGTLTDVIYKWMGWCPNAHTRKAQEIYTGHTTLLADNPPPDMPPPGIPAVKAGLSRNFITGFIVGCMVLLCLGGFPWWAFFVLTILIAGVAYGYIRWHYHSARGVC